MAWEAAYQNAEQNPDVEIVKDEWLSAAKAGRVDLRDAMEQAHREKPAEVVGEERTARTDNGSEHAVFVLITLPGERPVSLNQWYSGQHWTKRKREAERVHALVRAQLDGYRTFTRPVCITVTAYFKSRPQDASNIVAKIYEDALIGYVLIDDSPKYVRSMTTESRIDKSNPRIEIRIQEAQQ